MFLVEQQTTKLLLPRLSLNFCKHLMWTRLLNIFSASAIGSQNVKEVLLAPPFYIYIIFFSIHHIYFFYRPCTLYKTWKYRNLCSHVSSLRGGLIGHSCAIQTHWLENQNGWPTRILIHCDGRVDSTHSSGFICPLRPPPECWPCSPRGRDHRKWHGTALKWTAFSGKINNWVSSHAQCPNTINMLV